MMLPHVNFVDPQTIVNIVFLHCPKFQDIRDRHRKAIIILSHARPGWLYHPFAWQFPHFDLIREFFS